MQQQATLVNILETEMLCLTCSVVLASPCVGLPASCTWPVDGFAELVMTHQVKWAVLWTVSKATNLLPSMNVCIANNFDGR